MVDKRLTDLASTAIQGSHNIKCTLNLNNGDTIFQL